MASRASSLPCRIVGLAYGDGLFESIAVRRGRAPLLDWHLARLQRGCERLRLPCPTAELLAQLTAFIAEQQDGVVKLILTRVSASVAMRCLIPASQH